MEWNASCCLKRIQIVASILKCVQPCCMTLTSGDRQTSNSLHRAISIRCDRMKVKITMGSHWGNGNGSIIYGYSTFSLTLNAWYSFIKFPKKIAFCGQLPFPWFHMLFWVQVDSAPPNPTWTSSKSYLRKDTQHPKPTFAVAGRGPTLKT